MLILIFLTSFIIALSGAMAPGPLLVLVLGESRRHGWKTGPLVILGHAMLETLMVAVLLWGGARFLADNKILFIISFFGAALLSFFGFQLIFFSKQFSLVTQAPPETESKKLVLKGILVSLANPYWSIWWVTAGLGLLLTSFRQGLLAVGVFLLGHLSADFLWYFMVAFLSARGQNFISPAAYRWLLVACGVILVIFAGYIFLSQNLGYFK